MSLRKFVYSLRGRAFVSAFCVFFAAVYLHSASFAFINAAHTHERGESFPKDNCAVCVHLAAVQNLLNSFLPSAAKALLVFAILRVATLILKPICFHTVFSTLVLLKVRFNN